MSDRLNLPPRYRRQIEKILREHAPYAEVWAYGSRIKGSSHEASDLDLALRALDLEPIPTFDFDDLRRAFQESDIPIIVQAHDWARLPSSFHREIERDYVTLLSPESAPPGEGE